MTRAAARSASDLAPSAECRPFLKWAGGKTQLLAELTRRLPPRFNRYFEPFLGGGALFFRVQPRNAFLSDINAELINSYCAVRGEIDALLDDLRGHIYEARHYYRLRNADRSPSFAAWPSVRRAGRFIYLNKTCFNGLHRVNSKGHFNVPFGRYVNPTIADERNLRACARALRSAELAVKSFSDAAAGARRGDFVYFDPPYAPLSGTSNFTSYNASGFDAAMQIELRDLFAALDRKGVKVMLSNSSAPLVQELYRGFQIERVTAARAINSQGEKRGQIEEVVIRNYD